MKNKILFFTVCLFFTLFLRAQERMGDLNETALKHLINLINTDTSQPDGNELHAARYIYKTFNSVNQDFDIYIPNGSRANLISVIKGDGTHKEPLILMSHMDTVSAGEGWTRYPFKAVREDDVVFGLGSTDAKNYTAIYLTVFNWIKENNITLERDVVFLAAADEEAGSRYGLQWLAENGVLDGFKNAYALNEGGGVLRFSEDKTVFFVEAASKIYMDFKITAYGAGGHSATTEPEAVYELTAALEKLKNFRPEPRLNDVTRAFFSEISPLQDAAARNTINMLLSEDKKKFLAAAEVLKEDPFFRSQLFDICTPTVVSAGDNAAAVSSEAGAVLNCRLLPDTDPDVFSKQIQNFYEDNPAVTVEILESPRASFPVPAEPKDVLYEAIRAAALNAEVNALVVPGMTPASGDGEILRRHGITVYGLGFEEEDASASSAASGSHGKDENIKIKDFNRQLQFVYDVVNNFAVKNNSK